MYFIGLMSGTSVDAIDTALVETDGNKLTVLQYRQYPFQQDIQSAIRSLNSTSSISSLSEIDVILGELFASAVSETLSSSGMTAEKITAIGSHGQTILHIPEGRYPRTLQIGDPNIIAVKTRITTVADFRRSDIAAGGQGAPLAPAFHAWRFRSRDADRIVLNLGGMANITILPADINQLVSGFDTGPGNALMDDWIQRHLHRDYDHNGEWAASGVCNTNLLKILLDEPFFTNPPPKSTGKDDFNLKWLDTKLAQLSSELDPEHVQATLLEFTALTICRAITDSAPNTQQILLCGGGSHNLILVKRLRELLADMTIVSTADYGLDPDAVEAVTFAWLAKCRLENIPTNIPAVTGANRHLVLGALYNP